MFKIGDKVVYMSTTTYRYTKHEVYTIDKIYNIFEGYTSYRINGLDTYINNFIPLKEYRKRKLNKICLKYVIK